MIAVIDPGLKGAICFAGGDICEVFDLPYCGKEIDDHALAELFSKFKPDAVTCEVPCMRPGPKKANGEAGAGRSGNAKSSFINFGRLKQFSLDRGASWHEVYPVTWTKGIPSDKKERVRICREKYPHLELPLGKDGRADALLMKEWVMKRT